MEISNLGYFITDYNRESLVNELKKDKTKKALIDALYNNYSIYKTEDSVYVIPDILCNFYSLGYGDGKPINAVNIMAMAKKYNLPIIDNTDQTESAVMICQRIKETELTIESHASILINMDKLESCSFIKEFIDDLDSMVSDYPILTDESEEQYFNMEYNTIKEALLDEARYFLPEPLKDKLEKNNIDIIDALESAWNDSEVSIYRESHIDGYVNIVGYYADFCSTDERFMKFYRLVTKTIALALHKKS